jgi:hypothetical protein
MFLAGGRDTTNVVIYKYCKHCNVKALEYIVLVGQILYLVSFDP